MVRNPKIRRLAVQTVGDMISGIGARGPPPPPVINAAVYPPPSLTSYDCTADQTGLDDSLVRPMSSCSFIETYPGPYTIFLSRLYDPCATVRASWAMAIGQILSTSAGGLGLSLEARTRLVLLLLQDR